MKLKQWITKEFITQIPYIAENEPDAEKFLYDYIRGNYGNKETSALVDVSDDTLTVATIVNGMFADKWEKLKSALAEKIPITGTDNSKTEEIENSIYGFNGDPAKDYSQTKTTTEHKEFENVYRKILNNVAMREQLAYYKNVAEDIATVIITPIYSEEEGD